MSDVKVDKVLDLKGLNCPMPVLKTKKALDAMQGGEVMELLVTDAGSKSDIPALLNRTGNTLVEMKEAAGVYTFIIKKNA